MNNNVASASSWDDDFDFIIMAVALGSLVLATVILLPLVIGVQLHHAGISLPWAIGGGVLSALVTTKLWHAAIAR